MKIFVKTFTAEKVEVEVEETDTVAALKKKFAAVKNGIPEEQIDFMFQGKRLVNEKTLQSYKITEGSLVFMVIVCFG